VIQPNAARTLQQHVVIRGRYVDVPGLQIGTMLREQDRHSPVPAQDFQRVSTTRRPESVRQIRMAPLNGL
jgi:hypothetical protein